MTVRLGHVLYWGFGALAALLLGLGGYFWSLNPADFTLPLFFAGLGVIAWLFGRACRYVLSSQ